MRLTVFPFGLLLVLVSSIIVLFFWKSELPQTQSIGKTYPLKFKLFEVEFVIQN